MTKLIHHDIAIKHVTGESVYINDMLVSDQLLLGKVVYSKYAHAKIKKIDISNAEKMEGVEAIALYKDIPGKKRIGPIRQDHYVIVNDEVFYTGDVVAVVAAKTKEQSCAAADAIEIEYEPIEGIFDPAEAIKPTSRPIHADFKNNIVNHYPLVKGDINKETIWATQAQIAKVFDVERSVITKHIRNILKDKELNDIVFKKCKKIIKKKRYFVGLEAINLQIVFKVNLGFINRKNKERNPSMANMLEKNTM